MDSGLSGECAHVEKAIDIKRRAQRCVQSGDLDGALREYAKLVEGPDVDPYHYVLLADLLYKKGEAAQAATRYLEAVQCYQRGSLFKNAIAVCKKMLRLNLSQGPVLRALAELHAADGLAVEAALYFAQYAEDRVRAQDHAEAAYGYRKAFESSRDQVQWLERLAEVLVADGQTPIALSVLSEAIGHHRTQGHEAEAARCEAQARQIDPSFVAGVFKPLPVAAPVPVAAVAPEPEVKVVEPVFESHAAAVVDPATVSAPEPGFERTRVFASPTHAAPATPEVEVASHEHAPRHAVVDDVVTAGGHTSETEASADAGPRTVEDWLNLAQEQFRAGDRDAASHSLVSAAHGYESAGHLDSAATILRSLGRAAHASHEVLEAWLANCEHRADRAEGGHVACELGDRLLNEGDHDAARTWFEKALAIDPANEIARRRLQRLTGDAPRNITPMPFSAPVESGRVEVALGGQAALTTDLDSLLGEFQRGVEAQLEGDAQGHYDLGMAYRDMGLYGQAVEAFRIAAQDPGLSARAHEMVGRSLADAGEHELAAEAFAAALSQDHHEPEGQVELRLELAQCLAMLGDHESAIAQLETADACLPGRADVAERLAEYRAFRKAA